MPSPLPDPEKPFTGQDPIVLLAQVIFGEARNQPLEAKIGVASVVKNRVAANQRAFGSGWSGVITHPWQFSSLNTNDPNREKLMTPLRYESPSVWESCYQVAQMVYTNAVTDNTDGAVFYFSPPLLEPPRVWGDVAKTAQHGALSFYKPVQA